MQEHWERMALADPLWAILTHPEKAGGRWDPDEFFRSGESDVTRTMEELQSLGVRPARGSALDFGCGVGRLTQSLAKYFDRVDGVDISSSMISLANQYNMHPDRCRFTVNSTDALAAFPENSYDFIYSFIALQHIPPRYVRNYLKEFLRMLKPGGVLAFQLPSTPTDPGLIGAIIRVVHTFLYGKLLKRPVMYMYGIPRDRVIRYFEDRGARVAGILPDGSAGPQWISFRYVIVKGQQ
jgi:ubiquinone/menaquinone biosynthesis C-methylase UbiE